MALVLPGEGTATSNLANGNGPSLTYTIGANEHIDVESVVATVNNSFALDTNLTLTIRDSAGQVIATKRQADTIPAGDTGTATWALRLTDNGESAIRFRTVNTGGWLDIRTTSAEGVGHDSIYLEANEDFHLVVGREVNIDAFGGTDVNISADNDINEFCNNSATYNAANFLNIAGTNALNAQSGGLITLDGNQFAIGGTTDSFVACGGEFGLTGDPVYLQGATQAEVRGRFAVKLTAGVTMTVYDSANNKIFEVRDDGSLHGKTGKTLTFDL